MKFSNFIQLVVAVIFLQSCEKPDTSILWVSGFTTDCSNGAGKTQCIQVFEGEDVNQATWKSFYAPIKGFEFEPGYLQKIAVTKTTLAAEDVPADASSIRYELVEVIKKQQDMRTLLNGNWLLTKLNDGPINRMVPAPTISIDLSKRMFSANGGCNLYNGPIKSVSFDSMDIGMLRGTKRACLGKNIESEFIKVVDALYTYHIKGTTLTFFNKEGIKILTFIKK